MTTAGECKNCGTVLAGRYCSACGQSADVRIPSVGGLLADLLGDLFSFDSRIWRSVATLALKPGRLTTSYLEGQRARYTPPLRMYLAASVVFFLLFSLLASTAPVESAVEEIDRVPQPEPAAARVATPVSTDDIGASSTPDDRVHITVDDDGNWDCKLDNDLNPAFRERLVAACKRLEADGGAAFAREFVDNVPVMMLLFIPIAAAIMRVLYLFARRKYVEHLLFFANVHTLFFLLAVVTMLGARLALYVPVLLWPSRILTWAAVAYLLVYVYRAMRHVYRQGRALTAIKYVVLGISYLAAFALTLIATIIVTAATA